MLLNTVKHTVHVINKFRFVIIGYSSRCAMVGRSVTCVDASSSIIRKNYERTCVFMILAATRMEKGSGICFFLLITFDTRRVNVKIFQRTSEMNAEKRVVKRRV